MFQIADGHELEPGFSRCGIIDVCVTGSARGLTARIEALGTDCHADLTDAPTLMKRPSLLGHYVRLLMLSHVLVLR